MYSLIVKCTYSCVSFSSFSISYFDFIDCFLLFSGSYHPILTSIHPFLALPFLISSLSLIYLPYNRASRLMLPLPNTSLSISAPMSALSSKTVKGRAVFLRQFLASLSQLISIRLKCCHCGFAPLKVLVQQSSSLNGQYTNVLALSGKPIPSLTCTISFLLVMVYYVDGCRLVDSIFCNCSQIGSLILITMFILPITFPFRYTGVDVWMIEAILGLALVINDFNSIQQRPTCEFLPPSAAHTSMEKVPFCRKRRKNSSSLTLKMNQDCKLQLLPCVSFECYVG